MSEYKPKVGDRVKVTFEGEVTHLGGGGDGVRVLHSTQTGLTFAWVLPEHLEKVPDPEPNWVHGAVVKVPFYMPFRYNEYAPEGHWTGTDPSWARDDLVSEAWQNGTLQILWNGDE